MPNGTVAVSLNIKDKITSKFYGCPSSKIGHNVISEHICEIFDYNINVIIKDCYKAFQFNAL
jgi:hypothetical protein